MKKKERQSNLKNLKKEEDKDHDVEEEIIYLMSQLKKIENQVQGYEAENEKLKRMNKNLTKEQEKYGISASAEHAKYYQTIEEVKIKNN